MASTRLQPLSVAPSPPASSVGTRKDEEALVRLALPIVQTMSRRMARRNPNLTEDDFVSAGHQEAVLSARRWDPSLDIAFEAYAIPYIRWAMLQIVKAEVRQSGRRFFAETFHKRLLQAPVELPTQTIEELFTGEFDAQAHATKWINREVASMVFALASAMPNSINDEDTHVAYERQRAIQAAVANLKMEDRLLVNLFYRDEMSLEDIAVMLGVSYRSVKRLHQSIKTSLAESLTQFK